jgi:hypothetical protein
VNDHKIDSVLKHRDNRHEHRSVSSPKMTSLLRPPALKHSFNKGKIERKKKKFRLPCDDRICGMVGSPPAQDSSTGKTRTPDYVAWKSIPSNLILPTMAPPIHTCTQNINRFILLIVLVCLNIKVENLPQRYTCPLPGLSIRLSSAETIYTVHIYVLL